MKFVHTFWSKPLLQNKFDDKKDSVRYTLMNYACSAAYIHHQGYHIVLFTDEIGKNLLSFIPYDDIIVVDNNIYSHHFAARMKFDALEKMEVGDVLIDGDLFIRDKKTCQMIESYKEDVIYSFDEPHSFTSQGQEKIPYYQSLIDSLSTIDIRYPYHLPPINDLSWPNTSLLKINDEKVKEEYVKQYHYHAQQLRGIEFRELWPDIFIEQYFLGCLIDNWNCTSRPVIPDFPKESANDYALSIKFTHLGSSKKLYISLVEEWLESIDKELYHKTKGRLKEILQ